MVFEIIKPITATLRVECKSEEEALEWANKIVATIEDEHRHNISPNDIHYFEAEIVVAEVQIKIVD